MMKFEHEEGLPSGPNNIKVSGFFDNDMFNLNTGYSRKGDNLSFSSGANFNANINEKRFNADINGMLKANLLKGLTGSVGGNLNVNERGESVFSPNLDLKYHSNNLDAKVGYSGDKKIKAGLSGHKDFKNGLSIQGSVDSGYDLDKNKFIAPQVNAGLSYNFQAGGNAMYLTDDEIANYKAGGYTIIEDFEHGGSHDPPAGGIQGLMQFQKTLKKPTTPVKKQSWFDNSQASKFAKNYNKDIKKVNQAHKVAGTKPLEITPEIAAELQKKEFNNSGLGLAKEMFVDPVVRTAKKTYNDPLGLVSDLSTTAKDLWASPFTAGKELYDYSLGDGNFEINKVFDTEALGTSLDALSVIPVAKGVKTAFKTAKPILKYADNVLMNAPRAKMTLNSGVNPNMMVNAYQDARAAIDKVKGIKFPFSKTSQQLDQLKGSGAYWDEVGIPGKDLVNKSEMVEYVGTKSGRPVVSVKMPDGTTQKFYKSVGDPAKGGAGKVGQGVGGTTEGMWQPFGGFADHPKSTNWFIKDGGFKDFYGSKTYRDIAGELDNTLIRKFDAKNVDELDNFINFQNKNRLGDDFIPDFNHGGAHNEGYSSTNDGTNYTEVISNRPNDSYEYQRKKDLESGNLSYFQRKKGTDNWNTAGAEGTTGFRAITDIFGEDKTDYSTSNERKEFIEGELTKRAQEKFAEENPVTVDGNQTMDFINNYIDQENPTPTTTQANSLFDAVYNTGNTSEVAQTPTRKVEPLGSNSLAAQMSSKQNQAQIAENKRRVEAGEIEDIIMTDEEWEETQAKERNKAASDYLEFGKNITGINAAKSLYNKGAKQVVGDLANTAADIVGGTGEALYEGADYLIGDGSFDMSDKNWMTGNEYGSGLDTVLDVASILPAAGVFGKAAKGAKYLKPVTKAISNKAGNLSALSKKGVNYITNKLGDVKLPVNTNWTGGNAITVGDLGNLANQGLKYNPLKAAGINNSLTNTYGTGWGALTAMGIDNTVRGDNTFSDIGSGNFDLNKSALGRYAINAADDLSLINDSRKSASTQNTINEGYTVGDAAKIGINLSPMKFLPKVSAPAVSTFKAEAQLSQAPKYISKAFKKATDKGGVYAHEENNGLSKAPLKAGFKQEGGTSNYSEQYLTDAEIEALIAQGYTVEDFS